MIAHHIFTFVLRFKNLAATQQNLLKSKQNVCLKTCYAHRSLGATLEMWEPFLVRVRAFTSFISNHDVTIDSFSEAMASFRSFFESNVTKTLSVAEYLQRVVLSHTVTPLDIRNHLRQATAVLNEPRDGSDNPLCFTAGLTLGVHVDAEFENVCDPSCLRVQVRW